MVILAGHSAGVRNLGDTRLLPCHTTQPANSVVEVRRLHLTLLAWAHGRASSQTGDSQAAIQSGGLPEDGVDGADKLGQFARKGERWKPDLGRVQVLEHRELGVPHSGPAR